MGPPGCQSWDLWVPRTPSPSSSGNEPVLVDESAKDVGSSDERGVGIGDRDHHFGDGRGAPLIEGPVRLVPVVMIHVLGEDRMPNRDKSSGEGVLGKLVPAERDLPTRRPA